MNKVDDNILPEDKDVTQKVLTGFDFSKSMEKDIDDVENELDDRTIDFEEFDEFISERLSLISSWNSRSSSTSEELVDGENTFEEAFDIIHIPTEKDRKVLKHGESAKLNKVLSKSQLLIGQLTVMLKLSIDSLEYAEEAIDIQKQQKVRKEVMNMMQNNLDNVMKATAENAVGSAVSEAVSEAGKADDLSQKVRELEDKIESLDNADSSEIVDEVRDDLENEFLTESDILDQDLAKVISNSNIESKTDLGKILKHQTGLTNEQVAGIIDSSESTVSQW